MPENEKRYTDRLRRKSDGTILYVRDTEAIHEHQSLKTINGQEITGEGNVSIKTHNIFSPNWSTNLATEAFCESVVNDETTDAGMSYLGQLGCYDLPGGLGQAEAIVDIISNTPGNGKQIRISLTSMDVAPGHWEYVYGKMNGRYYSPRGWIGFQNEGSGSSSSGSGVIIDNEALAAANQRIVELENQVQSLLLVVNSLSNKVTGYHILSGVYINDARLTMTVSEMYKLVVYPVPSTAGLDHVSWESSDTSIVEVTAKGTVTAHAAGEAIIIGTAYGLEGEEFDIQCRITVSDGSSSGGDSGQGEETPKFTEVFSINVDDEVAIVNESSKVQLSNLNGKYFDGTAYTDEESLNEDYLLTVEAGSTANSFAFKLSNDTYLALLSNANELKTSNSINSNSSWTLEFVDDPNDENDKVRIKNVAFSDREIQWNSGSPRFACYTGSGSSIAIYKLNNNAGGNSGSDQPVSQNEIESLFTLVDQTGEEYDTVVYDSTGERTSVVYVED